MASEDCYMLRLTPEETLICTTCGGVIRGVGEVDPVVLAGWGWVGSTAHIQVNSDGPLFVTYVLCNECTRKEGGDSNDGE